MAANNLLGNMTEPKNQILNGIFHRHALARMRKSNGWTRTDLALRVGVSMVTIGKWEKGETRPKLGSVRMLASVFQVSISTFFTETKDIR
jgi:transcriptional regulator with XRE-family HTH domain